MSDFNWCEYAPQWRRSDGAEAEGLLARLESTGAIDEHGTLRPEALREDPAREMVLTMVANVVSAAALAELEDLGHRAWMLHSAMGIAEIMEGGTTLVNAVKVEEAIEETTGDICALTWHWVRRIALPALRALPEDTSAQEAVLLLACAKAHGAFENLGVEAEDYFGDSPSHPTAIDPSEEPWWVPNEGQVNIQLSLCSEAVWVLARAGRLDDDLGVRARRMLAQSYNHQFHIERAAPVYAAALLSALPRLREGTLGGDALEATAATAAHLWLYHAQAGDRARAVAALDAFAAALTANG